VNLHIPRPWALALAAFFAVGIAVFLFLSVRFGGPGPRFSDPYELSATFRDVQGLAPRADVLIRGVKVGEVAAIDAAGTRARVRLDLDRDQAPVARDATLRVGQKTLLGEAYVELDPGHRKLGTVPDGGTLPAGNVQGTVEIDEALGAFDARTRGRIRSLLATFSRGASDPGTAEEVNATLAELARTVDELTTLSSTLVGQRADISAGVQDSRVVLRELGAREQRVRTLVANARATLDALGSREGRLADGLAELPGLLGSARRTLHEARPLLVEARPFVRDLGRAAPPLSAALRDLRPVARDASVVLARLAPLNAVALPFLRRALPVVELARPVARGLDPALSNLVPMVDYLSAHRQSVAAWFTNTADLGLNGDAKGSWARFFIFAEPASAIGAPATLGNNSYTRPGDAADNQPYKPGDYPRLRPFRP
jgi:phospholipid/cholesterol/gamma-HCH transport system substrate-binding protein